MKPENVKNKNGKTKSLGVGELSRERRKETVKKQRPQMKPTTEYEYEGSRSFGLRNELYIKACKEKSIKFE